MIATRLDGSVLVVALVRPERRNAITTAMYAQLADAFERAATDDAVRAVLLHGGGTCFCAGNDLADFAADPPGGEDAPVFRFLRALSTCPVPVVAAVAGPAVGIGTTMLLHADVVLATDDARFSVPFVPLGLCPEAGSSLLLPRLLGWTRAAEMLLTGEPIDAATACAHGLVSRIVPASGLLATGHERAARIAAMPPEAVRETKRLMKLGLADAVAQRMRDEAAAFVQRLRSPEAQAAIAAFLARRADDGASRIG